MSIFYIDLYNGNDSNNGSTWELAFKTITNGAVVEAMITTTTTTAAVTTTTTAPVTTTTTTSA